MGEIIIEIFAGYILNGIAIGLYAVYDWLKGIITGVPKKEIERKRLEKKWLYKKIILKESIDDKIPTGTKGTIMEIIDRKKVVAEFYNEQGNFIEINNQMNFEVESRKLKIQRK